MSANYIQVGNSGICFAHGPYFNDKSTGCPRGPKQCAEILTRDGPNSEYVKLAEEQVYHNNKVYTAADLDRAKAEGFAMCAEIREQLAALCHEQWSGWMVYLFERCVLVESGPIKCSSDASWIHCWTRQMTTPYAKLSEQEKDNDRKEADRFIELILTASPDPDFATKIRDEALEEAIRRLRQSPSTPLLAKIVEISDAGSTSEFGDADERLRAIRELIIGEAV